MPKAAIEMDHIDQVVPLEELGTFLTGLFAKQEVAHDVSG